MTPTYEQARAEAEESLNWPISKQPLPGDFNAGITVRTLRALLSGPPEPSEEEVGETIGYYFGTLVSRNPQPDMSGDPRAKLQPHIRRQFDSAAREAAQAVLALFRSRING